MATILFIGKLGVHVIYKINKRPKKDVQKPIIAPLRELTQSIKSNKDKKLSPIYNLTQFQKRYKKKNLIFDPYFHSYQKLSYSSLTIKSKTNTTKQLFKLFSSFYQQMTHTSSR